MSHKEKRLKWKIRNNVISELFVDNKNIIKPWGFETADSSAFFSLEENIGWRYQVLKEKYSFNDYENYTELIVQMYEGKWQLNVHDQLYDNGIKRFVEAVTLEDSYFMDFVMRFRFKKELIEYAEINDQKYFHKNTNIYYQFPVKSVFLKGKGFNINIVIKDFITPEGMDPVMYIRDNLDEWVVHVRMIPNSWDKEVIKICTNWAGTRPLPQKISKFLLKNKWIRDQLWYRGERKPYKCKVFRKLLNPCAFGMLKVEKDTRLMWQVSLEVQ